MHHFLRLDWVGKLGLGFWGWKFLGFRFRSAFLGQFKMLGYWNNGILMLIKRTFSRRDWSQMDELINCFLTEDDISQNGWAAKYLDNAHLKPYFKNLHLHVNSRNLHHYKGYQTLNDGIYILLKGEIRFQFDDRSIQKQKMKRTRTINLRAQPAVIINQAWQVFESSLKNCTTSMESFLLKITEEQAVSTSFYELSQMRHQLYAKQYLSLDHQRLLDFQETRKAFVVDMKIHSNFSFKKYSFRQVVSLTTPAIISSGSAKLRLKNLYTREFDQCGVLLPNLQYEVTSSELGIMIVQDNETLCLMIEPKQQENQQHQQPQLRHYHSCKRTFNSLHKIGSNSHKHYENQLKGKQRDKKAKEMSKVFKEVEPYSIISSHLCQKSLNFAKKHNLIHNTRKKKQNRYVHPLILFDIASQKSKLDFPSFSKQPCSESKDHKSKHLSAHKSPSQSESQSSILRKIKLSKEDYDSIISKYKQLPTETVKRKAFKLVTEKVETNFDDQQFS